MMGISRREAIGTIATFGTALCSFADTHRNIKITCPICSRNYEAELTRSESQFGQRLDMRPIGMLVSPPRIAVCPQCGFIDYQSGKDYTQDELKALREFVSSDDYKKLVGSHTTYYRLAKIDERLKKPHSQVAYRYLQASWQAEEKQKTQLRPYLQASLNEYDKSLSNKDEKAQALKTARFMKGELLRRLGKYDEATKHFETIKKLEEYSADPFPKLIALELDYIAKKNDQPHDISESPSKK